MRTTMRVLVVKSDFLGYGKGSVISDEKTVNEILAGAYKVHVVAAEHEAIPVHVETESPTETHE
jgi:hypothetical protein